MHTVEGYRCVRLSAFLTVTVGSLPRLMGRRLCSGGSYSRLIADFATIRSIHISANQAIGESSAVQFECNSIRQVGPGQEQRQTQMRYGCPLVGWNESESPLLLFVGVDSLTSSRSTSLSRLLVRLILARKKQSQPRRVDIDVQSKTDEVQRFPRR